MKLSALAAFAVVVVACGKPADATVKGAALPARRLDTSPPIPAALAAGAVVPTFDTWVATSDTSPMDGTVSTRIAAISDGRAPGAGYAAMLFLECTGPKLDIFVATDDVVDYHDDAIAVRVRVDSAPAAPEYWLRSSSDRGAFSREPRALLAKLRGAHRLLLEIPIYNKGREVAAWSLDRLPDHLAALRCVKS